MADQVREGLEAPPPAAAERRSGARAHHRGPPSRRRRAGRGRRRGAAAQGLGWWSAWMRLLGLVRPFRGRVWLAFGLGVARVVAFIGVGVLSALVVAGHQAGHPGGRAADRALRDRPPRGPAALARILGRPRHGLPPAHRDADRALRQARQARARLPAAPAHRRHRRHGDAGRGAGGVFLRPHRWRRRWSRCWCRRR